jgi:hypothetical protein
MKRKAGPADLDRFLVVPVAAQFFAELREGDRRRILVDPASKVVNARGVAHGSAYGTTVTVTVPTPVRPGPLLSVTLRVTVYAPTAK